MSTNPKPPIVLLVYANDRIDPANHLRSLSEEIGRIRDALQAAEQAGLCQVLIEANASADRIFSVFQDSRYRNRIAILHYAGHANGYQLLLESASGGHGAANAEGFAAFLGQQRALELVFLNGCSTEQQVQGLLDANCSAVIATSHAIDDRVAMDFATRFYDSLGGGGSLEQAYNEAIAAIQTQKGSDTRALYWGDASAIETSAVRSPWELRIKPGAESACRWNLPDAVGNPLFGLPDLPKLDLPESPFRHLNWFKREHAEVFFGRGFQIRELFQAVTTEGAAPIVLFYGQSGVGKSSVLDAGLLPRLETTYCVHYLRRDQIKGLLGTLLAAFGDTEATPGDAWRKAEDEQGQPVLVVLDQVEEVFTRPYEEQPNELDRFIDGLHDIFGQLAHRPLGRLILGFRKEWLAEIDTRLKERKLPHNALFLETLDRRGVIEAITGPTRSARLQDAYKLEIEAELAEEIADDLLADRESPVAPTLQILLTKLWDRAREEVFAHPKFTRERYLTLKRDGILLGDFLDQQLVALEKWRPEVVQSGLALDVLAYHTTPKGTAAQCTTEELQTRYAHNFEAVGDLIEECKQGYLLSDIPSTQLAPTKGTRLAHDTLAPLVRERFEESDRPGQRVRRILESRAVDWADGQTGPVLDDADLAVVEAGRTGMRAIDGDEDRLVAASQSARDQRRKARNGWIALGVLGLLAVVILGGVGWYQWRQAERQERTAIARLQVAQASAVRDDYPQSALLLAAEAVKRPLDADGIRLGGAETLLRDLIASTGGLPLRGHKYGVDRLYFDPKGHWLATGSKSDTLNLWDLDHPEAESQVLRRQKTEITFIFDPQGRWLAIGSSDHTVRLWDLTHLGAVPQMLPGPNCGMSDLAFDPRGRWLVARSETTLCLWDLAHPEFELSVHEGGVDKLYFDTKGRWLVTTKEEVAAMTKVTTMHLWDLDHPEAESQVLHGPNCGVAERLAIDPRGRWLAAGSLHTLCLWDLDHPENEARALRALDGPGCGIDYHPQFSFDPQGRWLVALSSDAMCLWDLAHPEVEVRVHKHGVNGLHFDPQGRWLVAHTYLLDLTHPDNEPQVLHGPNCGMNNLAFDPRGRWLAGVGRNTVCLWDLDHPETEARVLLTHKGEVGHNQLYFDTKGRWLATGSVYEISDNSARLWDLDHPAAEPRVLRGHDSKVTVLAFDPKSRWLATGSSDTSARLWDLDHPEAEPKELRGGEGKVMNDLVFSNPGRWLASTSRPTYNTARLWNLDHPEDKVRGLPGDMRYVSKFAFDPQLRWLATESPYGSVRLWDLQQPKGEEPRVLRKDRSWQELKNNVVTALAFDPQGRWLATKSGDNPARLWDLACPKCEAKDLPGRIAEVNIMSFANAKHGRWIATGYTDGKVGLWDLDHPETETILPGPEAGKVDMFAFDDQGRWLAATSELATNVRLWDLDHPKAEPQELPIKETGVRRLAFDNQGHWLATGSKSTKLRLWDLDFPKAREYLLRGQKADERIFALDPKGRWLAAADRETRLWDLEHPKAEPQTLRGQEGTVTTLAFDYQGRWLATGSGDGATRLWHLEHPEGEPLVLYGHKSQVNVLAFDTLGRSLATAHDNGKVRLWQLDIVPLLDLACRTAGRNLTLDEWRQYVGEAPYQVTCPQFPSEKVLACKRASETP